MTSEMEQRCWSDNVNRRLGEVFSSRDVSTFLKTSHRFPKGNPKAFLTWQDAAMVLRMSGRIAASRSAAAKAAQAAKAQRDAQRLEHEKRVESALTDYYEETARARALRQQAAARAEKLLADAEVAAAVPEAAAQRALVDLSALGERRDQIADLTGLTLAEVRATLAGAAAASTPSSRAAADRAPSPVSPKDGTTQREQARAAPTTSG
ncbi:hypothetical protein [Streptacidiphilus sp. MAP5-3]|uniref:hypothetical protein n=1 Tax=unclassified Streptacidiphilus TaxID=2643834 RepID=UPI003518D00E